MSETNAANSIIVTNARQHNLKSVSMVIPKSKMVVFTGVSGSGKSSLAMDTIYAEGQRRYVESLSAYARQFLGVMDKPDVEKIEGLSPAIAIDQKTTSRNPRSTVGTITEVYDFLRILFARIGHPMCPNCGREVSRQSSQQIVEAILEIVKTQHDYNLNKGVRAILMSPIVRDRKGEFKDLFQNLLKQGVVRARIDGNINSLTTNLSLFKNNKHTIDAILSRFVISKQNTSTDEDLKEITSKITQAVETSLKMSEGYVIFALVKDAGFDFPDEPKELEEHLFSENFACPACNISLPELEPRTFSFNSPHGACPTCDGLGTQLDVDPTLLMNLNLTLEEGGIFPWANIFESEGWMSNVVKAVAMHQEFSTSVPLKDLDPRHLNVLLYGLPDEEKVRVTYKSSSGEDRVYFAKFEGVINNLLRRHKETKSDFMRREIEKYMVLEPCPTCLGSRLKEESLAVLIDKKNINDVAEYSIEQFSEWFNNLPAKLSATELEIATNVIKEINYRVKFLLDVGLSYLTFSRKSSHLSGGEAQRIRLASQIGSGLSGVLYVLDEPSIGLHARDQKKLINTLKYLKDLGNTVLIVEHDTDTMLASDYIFDFGPGAGVHGGNLIAEGTPTDLMQNPNSITGKYLSGKTKVGSTLKKLKMEDEVVSKLADKVAGKSISLIGASGRNLNNISIDIPLGKFVCITGVSGSGKSTLVMDTLHKALRSNFGLKNDTKSEPYEELRGLENIDKVIAIDQTPIGRTPKSNPATYTKTFDLIRELFSKTEDARIRGYKPGRFSFNVKGGRCEACAGEGQIKINMQFMPDVYVKCDVCQGKRYNRDALEISYKGKNISDVLDMTIEDAVKFFENVPPIARKLETLYDVGLGYMQLGQPAPTMSGGEAQRVKLALELSKRPTGSTFYILDEPTTGLHFADLERLLSIIKQLKNRGHTVLVIEHNLDIIKNSDWVIDLGPEGGKLGGDVIFSGPTNDLLQNKTSYTAQALREELKNK